MKLLLFSSFFALIFLKTNPQYFCPLKNGVYLVHFTEGADKDYKLRIEGNRFVQYFSENDSSRGQIRKVGENISRFELKKDVEDSVTGPLKSFFDSFGNPCIELNLPVKDTTYFRTTLPLNLHLTANEGYFVRVLK